MVELVHYLGNKTDAPLCGLVGYHAWNYSVLRPATCPTCAILHMLNPDGTICCASHDPFSSLWNGGAPPCSGEDP